MNKFLSCHLLRGVFVALILSLTACYNAAVLPDSVKAKALLSLPPSNKSYIYLIREKRAQGAFDSWCFTIDNEITGFINNGTFVVAEVNPGKHQLLYGLPGNNGSCVLKSENARTELNSIPGKIYYYLLWSGINLLSGSEGKRYLDQPSVKMLESSRITLP